MRHLLSILGASGALVTSALAQQQYGWSISRSVSDPFDNSLAAVGVPSSAFLWLACAEPGGMSAAEFALEFTEGTGVVYAFLPMGGFLNAGTATQLLLATSCPTGPVVAGRIDLQFSDQGTLCIVPDAWGYDVTVDCDVVNPTAWPNHTLGLTTSSGAPPCDDRIDGTLCHPPVSVERRSWGRIKGLYR